MAFAYRRNSTDNGHWVRHNTPAGKGLTSRGAGRWLDLALFALTFGTVVAYLVFLWGRPLI